MVAIRATGFLLFSCLTLGGLVRSSLAQDSEKPAVAEKKKAKTDGTKPSADGGKGKSGEKPAAPSTSAATSAAAAQTTQGLGSFGKMLPLGERNLNVKLPSFKDGRPNSMLEAACMIRMDDENMALEKLDIRLFAAQREQDLRVQLVTGNYHMPTQILTSEQRSRVSRQDFQLEGDQMIFDTTTSQGKLTGNVEMIIFDTSSMFGRAEEPEKKAPGKKGDGSGKKAKDANAKDAKKGESQNQPQTVPESKSQPKAKTTATPPVAQPKKSHDKK